MRLPQNGRRIEELASPCLLLDRERLERNLDRWFQRAEELEVVWRPHLKTSKSIRIGEMLRQRGITSGTVSTLAEAEAFLEAGWTDLIYAVPLTPEKLPRVRALLSGRPHGALKILVESDAAAMAVVAATVPGDSPIVALIELDCGAGRGGLDPQSPRLPELAGCLADGGNFGGVLTHAGHVYLTADSAAQVEIAEQERSTVVEAAERLRAMGLSVPVVSVGSTPTAAVASDLTGVTEFRPGNGLFFDLYQQQLGVCAIDEIAVSVLTRVIACAPERRQFWIDAGSLALSADRSANRFDDSIGYGRLADVAGHPIAGLSLGAVHQEHGFVRVDLPAYPGDFPVGTALRILPNHVCITAAMHREYRIIEGDRAIDQWERIHGW